MKPRENNFANASSLDVEFSDPSKIPAAPLVSIDMITYQHASFIREALDSILMQQVRFPYEICIGEDGSTDGTREICIEYAKRFPDKIRLFLRNRDNPLRKSFDAAYMFNAATTYDACRGKYIALLEGDDCWLHPHKLQRQVDQLESDPTLAASCHYAASIHEDKPWAASVIPDFSINCFSIEDVLTREVGNLHTSTWLLRRGKPMAWEGFKSSRFGDYPILVWSLLQGHARVLPRIWSMYRIHGQGVFSPLSSEARLKENVELWNCLRSMLPPELHSAVGVGTSRTMIMYVGELTKAGKFGAAFEWFRRTLAEIGRVQSSLAKRRRLRLLALESLLIPQLRGLRGRWHERPMQW